MAAAAAAAVGRAEDRAAVCPRKPRGAGALSVGADAMRVIAVGKALPLALEPVRARLKPKVAVADAQHTGALTARVGMIARRGSAL